MKEDQERTPLRTILQNFLNHIESLEIQRAEDSYEKEFQELKFFSEILKTSKQYSCSEGEKEVNRKKNRYKDILPFDNSRVILSEYAGVPGSDYINANYIKGASGSPAYIACQGPLPHTVNDFWRMVVECEVQVIVMACNEEEAGKHKCENYWVEREGEEKQFGMVAIRLVKASTVCPDFLVRTMRLKYTASQSPHISEERTVCQFHYSAWPDHGVPPLVRPLLDMVRLVRDTQASETLPVLVHCSAGCGRTGTICAIDYVWGLLRAGKLSKDFSLYKLVQDMRKQRIAMVQTKEQYVLVHQAVRELFREQLRMIDSHPYENIDANGMPLVKEDQEPTYASLAISIPVENSNEEKQDGKEKELEVKIPPLPQKKRLHVASSKHEKEVENLTEKQRSIVEQSSASHKPRIAKLKALFERSPGIRESRSSQAKQRNCPQVARSHSLGAMRIKAESQEEQLAMVEGNSVRPVPSHTTLAAAVSATTITTTIHAPQISAVQSSALTVRPSLPVKRSKSLKVLGSNQRCKLSLATTINSITPLSTSDDSSDSRAPSSTPVENDPVQREEVATNVKPFIPPKKYTTRSREVTVKDVDSDSARSSKKKELFKSQKSLDWMNYESSHMVPKRRRSLESVNFENAAISDKSTHASHNLIPPSQKSESLDDEARRILQDCNDYLVSDEKHSIPHKRVAQPGVTADILTLEAQRKVNAIIAGLGVRERRNSFRQAVGTGQEGEAKSGRKFKDYEAIWPCGNAIAVPANATSVQIQESHPLHSYVRILTDGISNAEGHVHQSKGKASTWFPKADERKLLPANSISVKSNVSQMSSLESEQNGCHYMAAANSNVRIGKLGIHPKQLPRNKPVTPERRLARSSQTSSEQASPVLSAQAINPSNLMQSPPRGEMIAQTPKSTSLWLRKIKSSAGPGTVDLRNHSRQDSSFYNVTEHEFGAPWVGKTTNASKVQTKEIPHKYNGSIACHRKAPVPNHEHTPNSRVIAPTQMQYKQSLSPSIGGAAATSSPLTTAQIKKPSSSQEISYGLVAGVQLRRGSRDDLALCPSPTGSNNTGPHAPSRVRRHASVVLLRRSLAETGGKVNSSLPHSSLTIWNSPTPGNGDKSTLHINHHDQDVNSCDTGASSNGNWLQAPGVDVDTVAASINPLQGDQSTSNLSRALESLHVRKSPHHKSNSMSNIQPTLSNGLTSHQLSQPTGMGKKQHYF